MRQATTRCAGPRAAVFLDRDGTLIPADPYPLEPAALRLLPGVALAIRRLRDAGFACVVITNQSALGRGLIDEPRLAAVHTELRRQLAVRGAQLDGIYYCSRIGGGDRTVVEHEERKPGPGMLRLAAAELGLDLAASWMVGDMVSDVLAGVHAGCRGCIWVGPERSRAPSPRVHGTAVYDARGLAAAARIILGAERDGATAAGRASYHAPRPSPHTRSTG